MKICFVAPANSSHIVKWCGYFVSRGHEVHVISFFPGQIDNVIVHHIDIGVKANTSDGGKLKYLLSAGKVRRIIDEIQPDIVNAHYASSYGSVMALTGLKGYVLSVWGSDVYDFPRKSFLHKWLLKFALWKAGYIFSTSKAMAEETHKYTDKPIEITPFGVMMDLFSPEKRVRENDGKYVVGTVKTLSPKYGIDTLLKGAALLHNEHPEIDLEVRIAGKGSHEKAYKQLVNDLGLEKRVVWLGFISQANAAKEWANFDTSTSTSTSESFGVSAVEAQACGTPIVITAIPGLMEATSPGNSSVVIPMGDSWALADALYDLYLRPEKRKKMGEFGRKFVKENYEYNLCFEKIERLFEGVVVKE